MLSSQQPVIVGFVPESSRAGLSSKMDDVKDVKDVKQDGHGWTHQAHALSSVNLIPRGRIGPASGTAFNPCVPRVCSASSSKPNSHILCSTRLYAVASLYLMDGSTANGVLCIPSET